MEPFKFVHCARLALDHQLRGAGPLPESIRRIVEDATLLAWERVVDECLRERADLLLLAGDSLDQADQSLRGAAELLRGFERLAERDVTVVMTAGMCDPWESWPAGVRWPRNVVRLDGADDVPLLRDGKLLTLIKYESERIATGRNERPRPLKFHAPAEPLFRICLSDSHLDWTRESSSAGPAASDADNEGGWGVEYHAAGGGAVSRTVVAGGRVIHDPGPAQALRPHETGPRGCTLVAVEANGQWRRTFVPTAPVRFEQLAISVAADYTRDDLLLEMIGALEQLPHYPSDRVWLISWSVAGRGACVEMLRDAPSRDAILADLHSDHGIHGVQMQAREVRLPESDAPEDAGDALRREFDHRLLERTTRPQWALQRCLDESRLHGGPWEAPLRSLLAELDADEIAAAARGLGRDWLAVEEGTL